MGTLSIDIETGSPFEEPGDDDDGTEYFEWFSVAAAYHESDASDPETTVLFRQGGWEDEYTADLLDRLVEWCEPRDIERVLTYNGAWFDLKHMANWTEEMDKSGVRPGAYEDLERILPIHIDVALAATDRHEHKLQEGQPILPDWLAYNLEDIENDSIWYNDYSFNPDYLSSLGIDDKFVKGEHIGQALAQKYVEGIQVGLEETSTHRELERLLYDYSISDIVDLYSLYQSLGGQELDSEYHRPLADIDR